jgi:hypothetical protein
MRIAALGCALSASGAFATSLVLGDSLGQGRTPATVVVALLVFYVVVSTPRRILDRHRVAQAREAPIISATAAACLAVTGSRPRTLILLRPRDPQLSSSLEDAARRVLLGTRVGTAVEGSARSLVSYSAGAAVRGVAEFSPGGIEQGDEESRGIASSSDLGRETKIPIMMTVCFFMPILLVLYSVFSHAYDAVRLGELASFEFIVVDLAFYLSAASRGTG